VLVSILVVALLLAASFWLAAWLSRPKLQFLPE
jgi:hypothetical protein